MRYLYGEGDESFPKVITEEAKPKVVIRPLDTYSFTLHHLLSGPPKFDKNDVSILFKSTPNSLLHLTSNIVDKLPLPCALKWNNLEVCRFIRNLGYPQYQRTFRKNLITGRKLLLVDAVALSNMNIKDFDHIKHIAHSIRCMFYFEMTKFARSISLSSEYLSEFYTLFRTQTGLKYESVRRTDLWKRMQFMRKEPKIMSHFDVLERHVAFYRELEDYPERIGGSPLNGRLYKECMAHHRPSKPKSGFSKCICEFLCDGGWNNVKNLKAPWTLSCINRPEHKIILDCPHCLIPPCTCEWRPSMFKGQTIMSTLTSTLPTIYAHKYGSRKVRSSFSSLRSYL